MTVGTGSCPGPSGSASWREEGGPGRGGLRRCRWLLGGCWGSGQVRTLVGTSCAEDQGGPSCLSSAEHSTHAQALVLNKQRMNEINDHLTRLQSKGSISLDYG